MPVLVHLQEVAYLWSVARAAPATAVLSVSALQTAVLRAAAVLCRCSPARLRQDLAALSSLHLAHPRVVRLAKWPCRWAQAEAVPVATWYCTQAKARLSLVAACRYLLATARVLAVVCRLSAVLAAVLTAARCLFRAADRQLAVVPAALCLWARPKAAPAAMSPCRVAVRHREHLAP